MVLPKIDVITVTKIRHSKCNILTRQRLNTQQTMIREYQFVILIPVLSITVEDKEKFFLKGRSFAVLCNCIDKTINK
jgi:hypothetical protein